MKLNTIIDAFTDDYHTMHTLDHAHFVASKLLAGVVDKQGKPLIDHCTRVMKACVNKGLSIEQCTAAMLHDCIEDSKLAQIHTLCMVDWLFGREVCGIVDSLTRYGDISYQSYLNRIVDRCPEAIPIKLADLEDNLDTTRGPINNSLYLRYLKARHFLIRKASS